ncbi:hypothetical protein F4680DRAFT_252906 [Xylaria scruposa]|nr:hypothetical protein F4680DRAFT_252906 [Xylaria scruposa]
MDLRNHSLNTVIGSNKRLWKLPQHWTRAHLRALCVDRESDGRISNLDGDQEEPFLHAFIPYVPSVLFKGRINMIIRNLTPSFKALSLKTILVSSMPPLNLDSLATEAVPFVFEDDCKIKLAVGRRAYPLPVECSFNLGSFMLPYLDSVQILAFCPDDSHRSFHIYYEPCISAILIAMAQRSGSSTDDSELLKTQLLFTTHRDEDNMYVYTAHISRLLLERFQYPNQLPITCAGSSTMPCLIKLRHQRVPYKPFDTFRHRLLAAVSITATTVKKDDRISGQNKRKRPEADDGRDRKRGRQPLSIINLSRSRKSRR